jgi:hypothetical protein
LQNIYYTQNNNTFLNSLNPFGNFFKIRDLNLKLSRLVSSVDQLTTAIQNTWFKKNSASSGLQASTIKVLITSQERYNSLN